MSCDIMFETKRYGRIFAPNGLWIASSEDGKSTTIHVWHGSCIQAPLPTKIPIPFAAFIAHTQECKKNNSLADFTDIDKFNQYHRPTYADLRTNPTAPHQT